jgi:hypothetical protein
VLLVDATEGTVAAATLQVQLLLHLIASGVRDLISEAAKLHEIATQCAFRDAGAFGELERVEPRFCDDSRQDA